MNKIIVLGCGRVGSAIAKDLAIENDVSVADISYENLEQITSTDIKKIKTDLGNKDEILSIIADQDLVIGAVPGFMGFEMVKTVISAGKNIVDISFFNEDIFMLDELAKKNNVIAVMDCGVAPGMDNIILGHHNKKIEVDEFECLVGGLPFARNWPYEYKAPFSPIDVIAEYTRPARYIKNGQEVIRPALSEIEHIDFEGIGTLEAFNTDGLRSLVTTMDIPNMVEKTLRYPGHAELMKIMRATGFFNEEDLVVKGNKIRPMDVTSNLLFPLWKPEPNEEEFTLMRVTIKGKENGVPIAITYDLFDKTDSINNISSMARTTGYTTAAVANLILKGMYNKVGISAPEFVGEDETCFKFILDYLAQRGVNYQVSKKTN